MKNHYPVIKGKTKIYKTVHAVETKEVDAESRTLIVKISTSDVDRSGDIVVPTGVVLDNYLNNPVVAAFHRYNEPAIAKTLEMKVADNFILAKLEFVPEGKYPLADILYEQYKGGFMSAWSIGFTPIEYDPIPNGGYKFLKWELFEYSAVLVPDNQNALTVMRSKGISDDDINKALEATKEKEQARAEYIAKKEADPEPEPTPDPEPEEKKDADNPADPGYTDDTKISELTVGQMKNLIDECLDAEQEEMEEEGEKGAKAEVVKDVRQVTSLAYVLSEIQWISDCFANDGVSQDTQDKLKAIVAMLLEVIKDQAELGKKSFVLGDKVAKAGRTISAKHEGLLKEACGHMGSAVESIKTVLDTVAEEPEEPEDKPDGDEGKAVETAGSSKFLQKLANSLKTNNQKQDLTLRLLKEIQSEKGGEK